LTYHWREKPGGGKLRYLAELNEIGRTIKMGRTRKRKTRARHKRSDDSKKRRFTK